MLKSRGRTKETSVMDVEEWPQVMCLRRTLIGKSDKLSILAHDGTPCAVKAACTVWGGGKLGDYIKELPIAIGSLLRYSGP